MIKIGEMNTKFCIFSEDETLIQPKELTKGLNNPFKLCIPTKIEPIKPPSDTLPQLSNDSKQNTSRLKNSMNETLEAKNLAGLMDLKVVTCEKNTTAVTISKKTFFESFVSKNTEYFVEKRYCTKCNLEQPLRCKHCVHCGRCVGTYDHHCAWIGYNLFITEFIKFLMMILNVLIIFRFLYWRKK